MKFPKIQKWKIKSAKNVKNNLEKEKVSIVARRIMNFIIKIVVSIRNNLLKLSKMH